MAAGAPRLLDGPRLAPRHGRATALVVLLHGYGANGDDLIALAEGWQARLPAAAFVAPNAPETIPGMPGALQWFALTFRDADELWRGVVAAEPHLNRFLDRELARLELGAERLALVGFSQGTMLALHVALRRSRQRWSATRDFWPGRSTSAPSPAGRRSCCCTARTTISFPSRPCTWPANSSPPPASSSSGTCGRASATASTPQVSGWPDTSSPAS